MNMRKLAANLLSISEAAAPLIGLKDELDAGKSLVSAINNAYESTKLNFEETDQKALQSALEKLQAKVNAHADKTIAKLG